MLLVSNLQSLVTPKDHASTLAMSTASDQAPAAQGSLERGAERITERRQLAAKLYEQGLTLKQIGEIVGRSESIVMDHLEALGIERRKPGPPKGTPRPALRKHPPPTPRPCARCGEVFTPKKSTQVGKFCSRLCHNRANAEAQEHKRGEWRTCLHCGERFWKYASQMEQRKSRSDFCTPTCWGSHRWWKGDGSSTRALVDAQAKRGHFSGRARRSWKLRWTPSPGRGRSYTDEQAAWVLSLAAQGYGHARIAETVGLHRDTVRRIRGREKRS